MANVNTTKPTAYPNWTNGGNRVAQPPPALVATGWQAGQPIPDVYLNYLFWLSNQWVQYFDNSLATTVLATSLDNNMRLVGGGTWSYQAGTTTLAWSAPFTLAIPSAPDSDNTVVAGQVTIPAGSVAYVQANLPFSTTGDVTTNSNVVDNLGYEQGIVAGMGVSGAGIPAGTTVIGISGTSCTLSSVATASNTQTPLTFVGTAAPTVSVAVGASLIPNPQTVIIARSTGPTCSVGVGGTEMWLRDTEQRSLVTAGFVTTVSAPAGKSLAALQAVYMSAGTADGTTAGNLYPCDAGSANGATRTTCVGFTHTATQAGGMCHVVASGFLTGFSGLTQGAVYFLDPNNPGGITSVSTTTNGQYIAPIGIAVSASTLLVKMSSPTLYNTVFATLQVSGLATMSDINSSGALTMQGNANTANVVVLKPQISGNTVTGFAASTNNTGANTWSVTDSGTYNGQTFNVLSTAQGAGFKTSVFMGSIWTNGTPLSPNDFYGTQMRMPLFDYMNSKPGDMARSWAAPSSGSIVGISGNVYNSQGGITYLCVFLLSQVNQQRRTPLLVAQFQPTAGSYGVFLTFYQKGRYTFNQGDSLCMTYGCNAGGANIQATADMIVELAP